MKMNAKKMAMVMVTLILMTGCNSIQKRLLQTVETTPSATMTMLQRDAQPEWTPSTNHEDKLAEHPDNENASTDSSEAVTVQEPAAEEKSDADMTTDEIAADLVQDVAAQSISTQSEMPAAQEQLTETTPQTETPSAAEEQPPEPNQRSTPVEQPQPELAPQSTPAETLAPEVTPVPAPAYGAIPFSLAEGTGKWWHIDATDSAYWAVAEQINAMRAAGGLEPLTMDETLSATASNRCESFVAGAPFDHSGMVTRSEICASGGPLGSAAAVCAAWQASEAHYANIMEPSFTRMGVSCWFCADSPMQMTYWTVTFE